MRFPENFDFVKGGKLPGLYGGTEVSGGEESDGTDGFSTRLMWRADGEGEVYLYAPDESGTSLGRGTGPGTGAWLCVEQHVVLNDPEEEDGSVTVWIDGTRTFSEEGMRYRTVADLRIDGIFFSTFFGGADPSWARRPTSMPTSPASRSRPADRLRLTHDDIDRGAHDAHRLTPGMDAHMRISVIGCGYLGAVHAASMAGWVTTSSASTSTRARWRHWGSPGAVLRAGVRGAAGADAGHRAAEVQRRHGGCGRFAGALRLRGHAAEAGGVRRGPRFVQDAVESLLGVLEPGTWWWASRPCPWDGGAARRAGGGEGPRRTAAWNPEFLREGFAVEDTLHPDRLVYGLPAGEDGETARALLDEVYASIVARGTPKGRATTRRRRW